MIKFLSCSKKEVVEGKGKYPLPRKGRLVFLLVTSPTSVEIKNIVKDFSLDEKIIRGYSKANYSKRLSLKPFQFVFVDYYLVRGEVVKTKNLYVMSKNFLIIFSEGQDHYIKFFELVAEQLKEDRSKGRISYLFYRLLEEDIEENYEVLRFMEHRIHNIESDLIQQKEISSESLLSLKRDLFNINKAFWASTKIIFSIKNGLVPLRLDMRDQIILEDIYHTFQHQIDVVFTQKEMVTDMLEIYVSNISNMLNKVVKTLTALTVIIAVPTLISSIYGMNFRYIPLASPIHGFYLMCIIMAIIALLLFAYFYKKEWL